MSRFDIAKLTPFSRHEAVLLPGAYLEARNAEQPRLWVVKRVSEDLRKMAINNGIEVNDVYRNVNGISFRMSSIGTGLCGADDS